MAGKFKILLASLLAGIATATMDHPEPEDPVPAVLQAMAEHAPEPMQLKAITTIKAGRNGHFVVDALIQNVPIKVLIDTGASAVAMSYEDAERVGISPFALDFNVPISTANGIARAAMVRLRQVEIDSILVRDVDGLVLQKGAMRGTLLGMSFLSKLQSFKVENGVLHLKR